ncbi:MAG: hypothetical protein H7A33_07420 [Deltaproteobacteria bacterium]|nr:hypothetical protein [Deltaproteobacteria bacterium]
MSACFDPNLALKEPVKHEFLELLREIALSGDIATSVLCSLSEKDGDWFCENAAKISSQSSKVSEFVDFFIQQRKKEKSKQGK